ncbi:hypothetical protein BVRB_009260 [Beta vulgaris subsp. vulgaris]|uniref:Uncharacterized protein n=1 Tax=Beta vulgaris subsp. vulgaris TaxID=3555 RepID=A0A0J8B2I6_BETVV|nr:hypothetical protein BVRB_009260 [Beta vulgaris subsp. vulgaris]
MAQTRRQLATNSSAKREELEESSRPKSLRQKITSKKGDSDSIDDEMINQEIGEDNLNDDMPDAIQNSVNMWLNLLKDTEVTNMGNKGKQRDAKTNPLSPTGATQAKKWAPKGKANPGENRAHKADENPTTYIDADGFQLVPTKKQASPGQGTKEGQVIQITNAFSKLLYDDDDGGVMPVLKKLKLLKRDLKVLNQRGHGDLQEAEQVAKERLLAAQQELYSNPGDCRFAQLEKEAQVVYQIAWRDLHSALQQKAKLHWLKEGDENSRTFYNNIKARQKRNSIKAIQSMDGQWRDTPSSIVNAFLEFYQQVLGTCMPSRNAVTWYFTIWTLINY